MTIRGFKPLITFNNIFFNFVIMNFINQNFLLGNETARRLYHDCAENLPIIDYHCHLSPKQIAEDHRFSSITELWLSGDHYKWRLMRANGIAEEYVTGHADDWDKFRMWAATIPYAMRNPIYHWTHLELKRIFDIDDILCPDTARSIFDRCNEMLSGDGFTARSLLKRFNVETLCTTDDPADSLEFHRKIGEDSFQIKVLPTWRPDRIVFAADKTYIESLGKAADIDIVSFATLADALGSRHRFFASMGCRLSDHGLRTFPSGEWTDSELEVIFGKILCGKSVSLEEQELFAAGVLHVLAEMDAESDWVQQFHVGPIRNCRSVLFESYGPDCGCDAIDDADIAARGHKFLNALDKKGHLARTILYNLNPKDSEALAVMAGTFNDGTVPGKIQYGAAWWFLDNENGIREQLDIVSRQGLLGRFIGMLTDSRSFVSYPRHEYFRRILCDIIGSDIETGKLPASEMETISSIVAGICYYNAKSYFNF